MSDIALAQPTPKREIRADKLTPKLRKALDLMIWDALPFNEAATQCDINVRTMRLSLARPHVMQYLKQQKLMLLASDGPRRIHRYIKISAAAENMPAVAALDRLEEMGEERGLSGSHGIAQSNPGVTIVITHAPGHAIDRSPVIDGQSTILSEKSPNSEAPGKT